MTTFGSVIQRKCLEASLFSSIGQTMERKTPHFRRPLERLAKKPSMAFSEGQEAGTKWEMNRGLRPNQVRKTQIWP